MWQESHAMSKKTKQPDFTNEVIGVQTFKYTDSSRNRPVFVEVWYPTDENKSAQKIEEDVWIHPKKHAMLLFLRKMQHILLSSCHMDIGAIEEKEPGLQTP